MISSHLLAVPLLDEEIERKDDKERDMDDFPANLVPEEPCHAPSFPSGLFIPFYGVDGIGKLERTRE